MTRNVNVSQASLNEYVLDRHNMLLRILNNARKLSKITESMYLELSTRIIDADDWETAFDQLHTLADEIVHAIDNYEYYRLIERLEKGERMIAEEDDPTMKAKYKKLYDTLAKELEGMELK